MPDCLDLASFPFYDFALTGYLTNFSSLSTLDSKLCLQSFGRYSFFRGSLLPLLIKYLTIKMMNLEIHKQYNYSVYWSVEDQEYVATCTEFPSLSWLDEDSEGAVLCPGAVPSRRCRLLGRARGGSSLLAGASRPLPV